MPIELHDLQNEPVGHNLQMLLVGAEKSGKSELAATAPDPVLFLDFDLRANSLSGRKGVFAVTFRDPASTLNQPTAFNEMLDILTKLEKSRKLVDLGFKTDPTLEVKTLVFDSASTIANSARRYVLYSNPKDLAYIINVGSNQFRTPRNWHGWTTEMEMVEAAIVRSLGINGLNVIVNLHEAKEEAEDSTEDNPKFTGQITVFPVRYRVLLKYFNEVWRLSREKAGPPMISCNPDGKFTKSSSAMRLDGNVVANIKQVLEQYQKKQQTNQTKGN